MTTSPHITISVRTNPLRTVARLAAAIALVVPLAGAVTALASSPAPAAASTYQTSALFTPNATTTTQFFQVPPAVTQLAIDAKGGQGGDGGGSAGVSGGTGGNAAEVIDLIGVTPGQIIVIDVGRAGEDGQSYGGHAGAGGSDGSSGNPGGPGGYGDGAVAGAGGGGGAATKVGPSGGIYLVAGGGGGGGGGGGISGYHGGNGGVAADPPGGGTGGTGPGAGSGGGSKLCNDTTGGVGGDAGDFTAAGGGGGGGGGRGGINSGVCGGAGGNAGGTGAGGGGGGAAGASYVQASTSFGSQILTSDTGGDGSVLISWAQPDSRTTVSSTGATTVGGARTFTATVSSGHNLSTPTPTGDVSFYLGSHLLGSASLVAGKATLTTADLTGGDDTVYARYAGDAVYAPSQGYTSFSLAVGTPQVQAGATPNPTSGSAHLVATVSPPAGAAPSAPIPTGSVHFFNTSLGRHLDSGTYPLDENGHVDVPDAFSNYLHLYTFDAVYSGDGNYESATTSFSVRVLDTTVTSLTSGRNPAKAGQIVPLTATVSDYWSTPTGTVTFVDGSTVLGTATLSNGQATFLTTLTAGTHASITAWYHGDDAHFGSVSQAISQRVDPAAPPVADAGPDQTARKGTVVTVDGTTSSDPQDEPLTYEWEQIGGLPATIADKRSAHTTVTLPNHKTTVTLRLTVTNAAGLSSTSDVTITVSPK
jgi:hypothetical protein